MAMIDWIKELSTFKLLLLIVGFLLIGDMLFYYIGAFTDRTTAPYPILYEIFSLLKEIKVTGGAVNPSLLGGGA